MNGRVAKKIRKEIYGEEGSSKFRKSYIKKKRAGNKRNYGHLMEIEVSDPKRHQYQEAKKNYVKSGHIS